MPAKKRQLPKSANLNQPPLRRTNKSQRSREYLTPQEVDKLRKAAKETGRHGHRDDTLILLLFRHGLRVSELIALRWEQIDLEQGLLHVWDKLHICPNFVLG